MGRAAQKIAGDSLARLSVEFTDAGIKRTFFVGLWSRLDDRERRRLDTAVLEEPLVKGSRSVIDVLSSRLSEDRRELAALG